MIPISLTLKGLYSYQEKQSINFEKLLEGHLFGIFGAVGSGKSTILEAVSFALYGDTERLSQRDNRTYNMMNLKSDSLLIDFVFRNYDDQYYRFVVKGKRNGKDFEKVNTFERTGYIKKGETWLPLDVNECSVIIGLTYENFRRTIIIPQGKFQEFLTLGDKDRTQMLKDIFQLGKFEFFSQTAILDKSNNEILQNLTGQLKTYEHITAHIIEETSKFFIELEQQLKKEANQLQSLENELKDAELLQSLFTEFEVYQNKAGKLADEKQAVDVFNGQITDFEYCNEIFKQDIFQIAEIIKDEESLTTSVQDIAIQLIGKKNNLQHLNEKMAVLKSEYDNVPHLEQLLREYAILSNVLELRQNHKILEKRIADGQQYVDTFYGHTQLIKTEVDQLKSILKEHKDALPDINKLYQIREWFNQKRTYTQKQLQTLNLYHQATYQKESTVLKKKDELSIKLLGELVNDLDFDEAIRQLQGKRQGALIIADKLVDGKSQYLIQQKLYEFAGQLQCGEACPLCGSTDHPHVLVSDDVEEALNLYRENEQQNKSQLNEIDSCLNSLKLLQQQYIYQSEQLLIIEEQLKKDKSVLDEHTGLFDWSGYDPANEETVLIQITAFQKLKNQITDIESKLDAKEAEQAGVIQNHEKYKSAVEKLKSDLQAIQASKSTYVSQLGLLNEADFTEKTSQQLTILTNDLSKNIAQVKQNYELTNNQIRFAEQNITGLNATQEAKNSELAVVRKKKDILNNKIESQLAQSKFNDVTEVKELLKLSGTIEEKRKIVGMYQQEVYATESNLHRLNEILNGQAFDQSAFDKLKNDTLAVKDTFRLTNEKYICEEAKLSQMKKQFEERKRLDKEFSIYQNRGKNLKVLLSMFKGSGFVNYVSTAYLQGLCESANIRFYKFTKQQLRLEVSDRNDFQVRDYLNNGRVRSVKTLSGGQLFQASLCLALALAENVQQQNKAKQNFFFLDEGFGSLDKESLQTVFETLKELRKENRFVGVISHVEELQQEIDVFLKITNDHLRGSQIKASWQ